MHLTDFLIRTHSYNLDRPFATHHTQLTQREVAIVDLLSKQGVQAQGETSPLEGLSQESFQKAIHQLKCISRDWNERNLPDDRDMLISRLSKDLDKSLLAPSVVFGIESAVLSLAAAEAGVSLSEYLTGKPPKAVQSACLLQGDISVIKAYAAKYAADGFRVFKLKVGSHNIPLDIQKLDAVREIVPLDSKIRLDANGAWTLEDAVAFAFASGMDRIDFIEEPCQNQDDYEAFFQKTCMPWAIEAHASAKPIEEWEGRQGFKAIVVKPMIFGGITDFLELKKTAQMLGVELIVSSIFESAIGCKVLANLAAMTDSVCGLGTTTWSSGEFSRLINKSGIIMPVQLS